ncbi:tautomerase family protein [Salipiger sp.]|uniref:tautomerase family protein n=1 Tax=Salipiger sp. TaxID=2078585 RepID=UPI003A97C49E
MPHLILKVAAGWTDAQKTSVAEALTKVIEDKLGYKPDLISVAVEDIPEGTWKHRVYIPEIACHPELIFKKPGYHYDLP